MVLFKRKLLNITIDIISNRSDRNQIYLGVKGAAVKPYVKAFHFLFALERKSIFAASSSSLHY